MPDDCVNKNTIHQNKVELIGFYGSDETHAMSAWTSTNRDLDVIEANGKKRRERIPALLAQLAQAEPVPHRSPFEKSCLHFLVNTDIATHIHLIKHRIGVSVNGESARYKELKEDKFYVPADWPTPWQEALEKHMQASYDLYHQCMKDLPTRGFSKKRAKESARFFLPYANQIQADVMFNFTSFVNFQIQRNEEHAQDEVHEVARLMFKHVVASQLFTHSIAAWAPRVKAFNDYITTGNFT